MIGIEWEKIKAEYLLDETATFRSLAEKYGISASGIAKRSKQGGWQELRAQASRERIKKQVAAAEKELAGAASARVQAINRIYDKMIAKIEIYVDEAPPEEVAANAKKITSAIDDIAHISGIKSDSDRREQDARIATLEKAVQNAAENGGETGIVLMPAVDDGDDGQKNEAGED